MTIEIYFDGSWLQKTGDIYAGLVCGDDCRHAHFGTRGTSPDHAEWTAACWALDYAQGRSFDAITLIGDSNNVIGAMTRGYATDTKLRHLRDYAMGVSGELKVSWEHRKREHNLAGQYLEKLMNMGLLKPRGILG